MWFISVFLIYTKVEVGSAMIDRWKECCDPIRVEMKEPTKNILRITWDTNKTKIG